MQTTTQKPKSSYCQISRADFETVLDACPWDFSLLDIQGSHELTYIASLPNTDNRALLINSSIVAKRTGVESARRKGADAIRTRGVYVDNLSEVISAGRCSERDIQTVAHTKRTNRINNWVNNLVPKLLWLSNATAAAPVCENCNCPLVLRHRKSDDHPFWGCKNWRPRGMGCDESSPLSKRLVSTEP
jgi:hypothetical protein